MTGREAFAEWVPPQCTLPTKEQPLRVAEFNDLFSTRLRRVERRDPSHLVLTFNDAPGLEAAMRDLTAREAQCCSFFTFTVTASDGQLRLDVEVPPTHSDVLEEVAARARPSGLTL
jgi:hypothetical protein